MHDVGIHCVDLGLQLLRLQLHFTCSATLFLLFEVHACYDSAVVFTGKKVISVVVIFKIEVARDFYVTKQRISISWGCLSTSQSRLLEESSLRRATVGCDARLLFLCCGLRWHACEDRCHALASLTSRASAKLQLMAKLCIEKRFLLKSDEFIEFIFYCIG